MDVAVVTWDGGSNRQPFEVLCSALRARGDRLHVLSHEAHRALYESLGASFDPLPVGEKLPGRRGTAADDLARVMSVWLSPEIASQTRALLESARFDVAVVDVSMMTAAAACEAAGVPTVILHHTLPGATWTGPRAQAFAGFVDRVNPVRAGLGLAPVPTFADLMATAAAHVVPTAASLDAPVPWPLPMHYVGPLQPIGDDAVPELPDRFVLVSFSTTWQQQVEPLQRVVDALASLDRPVVVTTGPAVDPAELTAAANTTIVGDLPHRRVLHRADAAVTHAGHGTVLSALTAGVPLVCMPMGRDQHDITARVLALGAGVSVPADAPGPAVLRAVREVLEAGSHLEAALGVASAIAAHGGVDEALAVVDRVAAATRP